jgi:hypothetical protein
MEGIVFRIQVKKITKKERSVPKTVFKIALAENCKAFNAPLFVQWHTATPADYAAALPSDPSAADTEGVDLDSSNQDLPY